MTFKSLRDLQKMAFKDDLLMKGLFWQGDKSAPGNTSILLQRRWAVKNVLWSVRQKWQDGTGQELSSLQLLTKCCPYWTNKTLGSWLLSLAGKRLPVSQKSPSDTLGEKAKDGCSNVGEEAWATVQPAEQRIAPSPRLSCYTRVSQLPPALA